MKKRLFRDILSILLVMIVLPSAVFAFERAPEYQIDSITLYDAVSGSPLSLIPQDRFLAEVKVSNTDADGAGVLMVAQYSAEGRMVDLHSTPVEMGLGTAETFSLMLDNTNGQTDAIRGFVVSASESTTPLAEVFDYVANAPEEDLPDAPSDYTMVVNTDGNTAIIGVTGEMEAEDHVAVVLLKNGQQTDMGNAAFVRDVYDVQIYAFENTMAEDLTFVFRLIIGGQIVAEETVILPTAYVGPPWLNGGKQPWEYTWAEYEALDDMYKDAFFEAFGDVEAFIEWMEAAQNTIGKMPWEEGGKLPSEYTWAEFEELTGEQQMAFQNWFGSGEAFEAWMEAAQNTGEKMPWEDGGKQPSDYTWEEYDALSGEQQMAFQNWFASSDAFEAWMEAAQNTGEKLPWEDGGNLPSDYTWEEYDALSGEQQMAFQNWFGSGDAFEAWMEAAQNTGEKLPWEDGGKLPSEYAWAEYEALSSEEQMAFQNWFADEEAFEAWMEAVQAPGEDN